MQTKKNENVKNFKALLEKLPAPEQKAVVTSLSLFHGYVKQIESQPKKKEI